MRSVTSLLALKTDRNLIASGGSADGCVIRNVDGPRCRKLTPSQRC